MPKKFYIVRHGKKVSIPGDPPLSEEGQKQAILTAKHFMTVPITKIVASPILRSQQTAKYIGDMLNVNVETSELLRERSN